MLVRAAGGYYGTSYYLIAIESDEDIDIAIEKNNRTFVHEYMHFLQDIFLPYNLRQNLIEQRNFRLIVSKAQNGGFVRPFNHWDFDALETNCQLSYTWGDNRFLDLTPPIQSLEHDYFISANALARVFRHWIIFEGYGEYQFGARDLLEYIASKIESKHWGESSPDLPYRSVDKVLDFLGLEVLSDESRIALVESCLHNDNPAHHLFFMIQFIKDKFPKKSLFSYELFRKCLSSFQWDSAGGFSETLQTKTERRLNDLKEQLQNFFGHADTYEIKRWIEHVDKFVKHNMQGRLFFSELYRLEGKEFFDELDRIIAEIGIPIVMNAMGQMTSLLPPQFDVQQFLTLYVNRCFVDFAIDDDPKCKMYDFCRESNARVLTSECSVNPIARGRLPELCPFGELVKKYNLYDINSGT